jgi:hypothetical protein
LEVKVNKRNQVALTVLALFTIALAVRAWFGSRTQPQLPGNDEVFKTVDALFTAVTAHDPVRLDACEQKLNAFQQDGLLRAAVSKRLKHVISVARAGEWEAAAHQLYDFMHGQRHEAAASNRHSSISQGIVHLIDTIVEITSTTCLAISPHSQTDSWRESELRFPKNRLGLAFSFFAIDFWLWRLLAVLGFVLYREFGLLLSMADKALRIGTVVFIAPIALGLEVGH